MTHVKLGYLINETAPKSLSVYSPTSRAPAAIAGRSCGNMTRNSVLHAPCPRLRDDSSNAGSQTAQASSDRQKHVGVAQEGQRQRGPGQSVYLRQAVNAERPGEHLL